MDRPRTDKHNDRGTGNDLRYGLSSMQGWRIEMEDAHCAIIGLPGLPGWSFFAIFDGHAGAKVSAYSAEKLLEYITGNADFRADMDTEAGSGGGSSLAAAIAAQSNSDGDSQVAVAGTAAAPSVESVKRGIRTGFLNLDAQMRQMPEVVSGEDKSGSTAVCAIITPSHVFFGNCGDSRGVLARSGKLQFSTQDHKPINPVEKERIQRAGGSVMIQRVNGSLAVSRALGDYEYKNVDNMGPCEQLVSPEPDISDLDRDVASDEFLVLACDGIWDVMTNEDVCDFVRHQMRLTDNLEEVCNLVVDTCLFKGSRDNMSVIIVAFAGSPTVSEEAIKQDKELDMRIEAKVKELFSLNPELDTYMLMRHLSTMEVPIEGLPPGGGIHAKHHFVAAVLKKLQDAKGKSVEDGS